MTTTETITTEWEGQQRARPLQMLQLELDQRQLASWMGAMGLQDLDFAIHCLLTECLGESRPRVFRPQTGRDGKSLALLGYCRSREEELEQTLQMLATPLQRGVIPRGSVKTKEMPHDWSQVSDLGFEIRVRPIVRLSRRKVAVNPAFAQRLEGAGLKPGSEYDVHRWRNLLAQTAQEPPVSKDLAYAEWLSQRAEQQGSCTIDPRCAVVARSQETRAVRDAHQEGFPGPDVVMRGLLQIQDPSRFEQLLEHGLGRHRAYGYGMLLLRPAMPPRN